MPPAKTSASCPKKSICEKSGEIAVTLTKISSLYLATLLFTRNRKSSGKPLPIADEVRKPLPIANEVRKPAANVMDPDEAVDARADEYIRRRRVGIFNHIDDAVRNEALNCIPPPPPPKSRWVSDAAAPGSSGRGYNHLY